MKSTWWIGGALVGAVAMTTGQAAAPDAPKGEAQFLVRTRQLTLEGKRSGEGYFSPEGNAVIFQSEREEGNPFYQIYILDLVTGDTQRVSPGTGKTTCAFFRPGSNEVLFASSHTDANARVKQKEELDFRAAGKQRRYAWDYDEHMDIFTAKRDGSGLRRLTSQTGYDAEGAFSPDGSQIVFCSIRDAYANDKLSAADRERLKSDPSYFAEIYIMNADGTQPRRLTQHPGYDGGPFFSPDGQRIIWRRFSEKGDTADVHTMKVDGTDVRRLTDFGALSWAPYFHPSSQYVVFASNKEGFSNFEVYLVDAAGARQPIRVTHTDGFDGLPVFSPDGRKLMWTSNRTENAKSQLFIAEWNHEEALAALGKAERRAVVAVPAVPGAAAGKLTHELATADFRAQSEVLASDEMEGRLTGTDGSRKAAEYIVSRLRDLGLQPRGDNGTFYQRVPFKFGVDVIKERNELIVTGKDGRETRFEVEKDYSPLSFTSNDNATAGVVFGGYGISVAGNAGEGYDSYAGLNCTNKVVMVLRYVPEGVEAKRREKLLANAALQFKGLLARRQGARGVIIVSGPNSANAGKLIPPNYDRGAAGSGIVAMSANHAVANALMAAVGKDIKKAQDELDKENPHSRLGYDLPGVTVRMRAAVRQVDREDRNIVAVLPPGVPGAQDEYVMVGAHYDHLGYNDGGLQPKGGNPGSIHNGADDNTSGSVTLLELAAWLAEQRRLKPQQFKRGVIFCWWTGEELGLLGSAQYARTPTVPFERTVAYLNFDMVGRLADNNLIIQGMGTSSVWKKVIEKANVAAGFSLKLQNDPYQPTDITSIYPKGVPSIALFTGLHKDYHKPSDDAPTLNYEGMERIAQFSARLLVELCGELPRPDYLKVERGDRGGQRDQLRAYIGTIPDYAAELEGVKLSGVRAGGPAEKGGLKGGDIIVEFNGQKVKNIYEFTSGLDSVKIGKPVPVVVLREGKRVSLSVTPEPRNN